MAKLKNLAACATNRLQQSSNLDSSEARIEVRALLQHAAGDVSHAWLIAHGDEPIQEEVRTHFEALLIRRTHGEPIAHILGKREFYGREFIVTPDTLIPRPDTETLIDTALSIIPTNEVLNVLDLGTGTGAIGITLALERPQSSVTLVDFSEAALEVARQNIRQLVASNVSAVHSHWFQSLSEQQFDLIVSNPPYIEASDPHLTQGDLRFEPISALSSGPDGLDDIRMIASQASQYLKPSGWLLLEHGYNQAEAVRAILTQHQFHHIQSIRDLSGHERITLGQYD